MRSARVTILVSVLSATVLVPAHGQSLKLPQGEELNVADIVDRMNRSETALFVRMRMYHPLVEAYIQNLAPDERLGWVATQDEYFLGQLEVTDKPRLRPLDQERKGPNLVSRLTGAGPSGVKYLPDGFAAMAAPDWSGLDRRRYEFTFVRREFLGEARTFVFDVRPSRDGRDGFTGRIWIDDRDYSLIRFNGINRGTDQTLSSFFRRTLSFHMDGWRINVLPGVWLPAYVYSEEIDLNKAAKNPGSARFKSQVRIWGYEAQAATSAQQQATIRVDEPTIVDATEPAAQLSPLMSGRRWEQEAEANVIERLEKVGLLSPPGEVDGVLETVLNNLVVTNHIALERPLRCRILLTSPLESFTIGRTIVLSRGLIDVLPDEASLATMIAHELAHVVLGHPLIDTKFAFADRLMVGDGELLQALQFHHPVREEADADERVMDILAKSPYGDKLAAAGLFVRMIAQSASRLPKLIQPHIGDQIAATGQMPRFTTLVAQAPALAPESLDQIPALSLGARVVVDPWSDRLTLDRSPALAPASIREKVPLAVTPLMPYLRYKEARGAPLSSR
ncbi:MAG TPA: M48 family metalloprotease [Vicinamibacterales bacterium]